MKPILFTIEKERSLLPLGVIYAEIIEAGEKYTLAQNKHTKHALNGVLYIEHRPGHTRYITTGQVISLFYQSQ